MIWLTARYRGAVYWAIRHRYVTVGIAVCLFLCSLFLWFGPLIGSEFLPHLDEGALWVRGTFAPSVGPDESISVMNQARIVLCSFPEVSDCWSQAGRPDDGTDHTNFFNTEYFVDLKPKEEWRPVFHENKDSVIAAMDRELEKIPGVDWGFSQPIADNVEEAVSGVKGQLATKVYGDDLNFLEEKADQIVKIMKQVKGIEDLGVLHVLGQPNLNVTVDRQQAARYQINVADVQDAIQTAVGGNALTQVLRGEARYDLVLRYLPRYRDTRQAIADIRLVSPSGERVSLEQLCKIEERDGGSEIYRQENQRYVAVKYSVRGRGLGDAVEEAIHKVNAVVQLPRGYHIDWEGEYESEKRAEARLLVIVPLTVVLIFVILFTMFRSFKWALLILVNVALARIGGLIALLVTGTHFSVSSGIGFLALFGVSVQTGVIMLEYINQLRARGHSVESSAAEGAVLRLRPIMMTMLVATLGLLPAAMSHAIGSDSQRPFAIVIVGGLISDLVMSIFLLPTLYVWVARDNDKLPVAEAAFDETA
jgi:cobalt-zinc-cadmium resistance protein CzcA